MFFLGWSFNYNIEEAFSGLPLVTKASFFLLRSIAKVPVSCLSVSPSVSVAGLCLERIAHMYFDPVALMSLCTCAWLLQAYSAAVQSQLQWVKQLCLCVEQHVKENAAYFQVRRGGGGQGGAGMCT